MTDAELKKSVVARMQQARANGVTLMSIEENCPPGINLHTICNLLNATMYPIEVWQEVDGVLKKFGY